MSWERGRRSGGNYMNSIRPWYFSLVPNSNSWLCIGDVDLSVMFRSIFNASSTLIRNRT